MDTSPLVAQVKRYSGLLVLVGLLLLAGIAAVAGLGWQQFYQQLLLAPISMPAGVFVALITVVAIGTLYRHGRNRSLPAIEPEVEESPESRLNFEDRRFIDKEVVLDGKTFKRCEFSGTDIVIKGEAAFSLSDCQIVQCRIIYDQPAAGVLDVFAALYEDAAFQPIVEETFGQIRRGERFS